MLDRYMTEIDRLEATGTTTARDLELLRSSPGVYPELMGYTLGDADAVTPESITRTLERVSSEIKTEESDKLSKEQKAHKVTQEALSTQTLLHAELKKNLHWRCQRRARILSWGISIGLAVIVTALLVAGLLGEMRMVPFLASAGWPLVGVSAVLVLLAFLNIVLGLSVRGLHGEIQLRMFRWFLNRESKSLGIDLE